MTFPFPPFLTNRVSIFRDGVPTGPSWHFLVGGTALQCPTQPCKDGVFISSDFKTFIRGDFHSKQLTLKESDPGLSFKERFTVNRYRSFFQPTSHILKFLSETLLST